MSEVSKRPITIINRLGYADYHCGACGWVMLRQVRIDDAEIPARCPHCGKSVTQYVKRSPNLCY